MCEGFSLSNCAQRSAAARRLDQRYYSQHGRATEIIGRLEAELEREREHNRRLREQNSRARSLTEGLTSTATSNVRNLSDAVELVGKIRSEVKILADFYASWDSDNGSD